MLHFYLDEEGMDYGIVQWSQWLLSVRIVHAKTCVHSVMYDIGKRLLVACTWASARLARQGELQYSFMCLKTCQTGSYKNDSNTPVKLFHAIFITSWKQWKNSPLHTAGPLLISKRTRIPICSLNHNICCSSYAKIFRNVLENAWYEHGQ